MKQILIYVVLLTTYIYGETSSLEKDLTKEQAKRVKTFYKKFLQKPCGYTVTNFAKMYTKVEWEKMQQEKTFVRNILKMCPNSSIVVVKLLAQEHGKINFDYLLYFSIEYAKDTGKIPAC